MRSDCEMDALRCILLDAAARRRGQKFAPWVHAPIIVRLCGSRRSAIPLPSTGSGTGWLRSRSSARRCKVCSAPIPDYAALSNPQPLAVKEIQGLLSDGDAPAATGRGLAGKGVALGTVRRAAGNTAPRSPVGFAWPNHPARSHRPVSDRAPRQHQSADCSRTVHRAGAAEHRRESARRYRGLAGQPDRRAGAHRAAGAQRAPPAAAKSGYFSRAVIRNP
jgi:hypothetical protein